MALLRQIDLTKTITIYGQLYEYVNHTGLESLAVKAGTTITLTPEDGDALLAVLVSSTCGHIAGDRHK